MKCYFSNHCNNLIKVQNKSINYNKKEILFAIVLL